MHPCPADARKSWPGVFDMRLHGSQSAARRLFPRTKYGPMKARRLAFALSSAALLSLPGCSLDSMNTRDSMTGAPSSAR